MEVTKQLLEKIEQGAEDQNINYIKDQYRLYSERNARLLLYIIENTPEKLEEKVAKEIKKLENKKMKAYKKIGKKMESYTYQDTSFGNSKIGKIESEIQELQRILN